MEQIEAAEVGPGTYRNKYFGLSLHYPLEWRVADRETLDTMDSQMQKAARAQLGALPSNVHVTSIPYYTLFFARTDGPIDSPENATTGLWRLRNSILIGAEKRLFINSAQQYFPNSQFLSDKTADGTRGPEQVDIGNAKFFRADRWGKVEERNIYQVRLVTYAQGLVLGIDVLAESSAVAEKLVQDLEQEISFIPPC